MCISLTLPAPNPCDPKRKAFRNQYKNKLRTTNEKFIKNMSDTNLTDQEFALLAKGFKFIPSPENWLHIEIYICGL